MGGAFRRMGKAQLGEDHGGAFRVRCGVPGGLRERGGRGGRAVSILAQHLAELFRDHCPLRIQLRAETIGGVRGLAIAESRGQDSAAGRIRGQGMSLQTRRDLELVLDVAQKEIGRRQRLRARRRHVAASFEPLQCG